MKNQLLNQSYRSIHKYLKKTLPLCIGLLFTGPAVTSYAADMNKVVHTYFNAAETGFDPIATNDVYSSYVDRSIFETLYSYDYLARPLKLVPLTATALPDISADGLTYTIHIKPHIFFADDPIFKGKKRELTSYDYAYSFKRILDPTLRSPNSDIFAGKFIGADQLVDQAKKVGKFNYDQPFEGIQTPDRYTLVLKLNEKDFNLPMILAHGPTAALAREVVEHYKDPQGLVMSNPVGTGPYSLNKWVRGSRIVLKYNPNYRGYIWNFKSDDPNDKKIISEMTGKKMPQVGVVDIQIIQEGQSQWLGFKQKQLDWLDLPPNLVNKALDNGELRPEYKKEGIYLSSASDLASYYTFWNMTDPVVGGLSEDKIALRRAMSMAFSNSHFINIVFNGMMIPLYSIIPPNIVGYDPNFKTSRPYNIQAANLLLDQYHYKIGPDGYRTLPNGKPLTIQYSMPTSSSSTSVAEFWQRTLKKIHIRMVAKSMQFPDYLRAQKQCAVQMGTQGWIADYPDGENFLQLFYGPNVRVSNFNCVAIPEFDRLFKKSMSLPNGPERQALFLKMTRLIEVYATVVPLDSPNTQTLVQPYIQGFKNNPILKDSWFYIDIKK
ncbi:heme-binding protein [Acinetobacter nectaris]|nr:ABC transporter substrate-binding protein [Acinetobacter nectaris]MCF9034038.1 heme-binding protein [Acinetobacter nectaris]